MGIYPFIRDCRTKEEKERKDFSKDLFCHGTFTTLVTNDPGSIDCACRKHRLIRGNKFKYCLSRFYRDHNIRFLEESLDVEFVRYVEIKISWYILKIAQLLINVDLSSVKNIRYYTCFETNEDVASIVKQNDGKYLITLPFTQMSIISSDISREDYESYYQARDEEKTRFIAKYYQNNDQELKDYSIRSINSVLFGKSKKIQI